MSTHVPKGYWETEPSTPIWWSSSLYTGSTSIPSPSYFLTLLLYRAFCDWFSDNLYSCLIDISQGNQSTWKDAVKALLDPLVWCRAPMCQVVHMTHETEACLADMDLPTSDFTPKVWPGVQCLRPRVRLSEVRSVYCFRAVQSWARYKTFLSPGFLICTPSLIIVLSPVVASRFKLNHIGKADQPVPGPAVLHHVQQLNSLSSNEELENRKGKFTDDGHVAKSL